MTFQEMYDTNGYTLEEVSGEFRYVTADERGVARVGHVHHGRRRRKYHQQANTILPGVADTTIVIPRVAVGVAPVQAPGKWAKRWRDKGWHRAVQDTALDVAMWATCLSLAGVALKAAYWVVTL